MALQADNKWHCKVTHYENGRVITRRIHSLAIQATDGRLYTLTDKKLPDAIALFTGETHSGEHMAEVLMNPKPPFRLIHVPGDDVPFLPTIGGGEAPSRSRMQP